MTSSPSLQQGEISSEKPDSARKHTSRSDSLVSHQNPPREVASRSEVRMFGGPESTIMDEALPSYFLDRGRWHPHLSHALRPSDHLHLSLPTQATQFGLGARTPVNDPPASLVRNLHLVAPEEHMSHLLLPAYATIPSADSLDHAFLSRLRENSRKYTMLDIPPSLRTSNVVLPYHVAQVPYDHLSQFADADGRIGVRTASTAHDLIRRQYLDESSLLAEQSSGLMNAYLYDSSLMYEARARALTRRLATENLIHKRAISLAGIPPGGNSRDASVVLDSMNDNRRQLSARMPPGFQVPIGKVGAITGLGPRSATKPKAGLAELLPYPVGKGHNVHFSQRICVPLSTDEDENWLSEFLCFVRADLIEVFRATEDDVRSRNSSKAVVQGQVGIRCRYCAHLPPRRRASRSSSYPFTLSRIYQSLTMMLRDHFGACNAIPAPLKERFLMLKGKTAQGATGSNTFWEYSAKRLGLIDSESGIWVDENADSIDVKEGSAYRVANPEPQVPARDLAKASPATAPQSQSSSLLSSDVSLVIPEDRALISDFLYSFMSHVQLIKLEESERIGNRKNLPVGIAGIGCRYCCEKNRKGFCRIFPARRRTLPSKINDLYEHVRRCPLCPSETREKLRLLKNMKSSHDSEAKTMLGEKDFFDRLWGRMCLGSGISMDCK